MKKKIVAVFMAILFLSVYVVNNVLAVTQADLDELQNKKDKAKIKLQVKRKMKKIY